MSQRSFSDLEYSAKRKQTRRDRFLGEIDAITPWRALVEAIEPHYPKETRPPANRSGTDAADVRGAAVLQPVG